MDERWGAQSIELVKHVPWRTSEDDPNVDGEPPEVIRLTPEEVKIEREIVNNVLRRVKIRKQDLENHGYTAKCQGCLAMIRGKAQQKHSDACRRRIEEEMKGEPRLERANDKFFIIFQLHRWAITQQSTWST